MKRTFALCLVLSLTLKLAAQQKMTGPDSTKVFYDELFGALKIGYLHQKKVDWPAVEAGTRERLKQYNNFKSALSEIRPLFDQIGATHCSVFDQQTKYAATGKAISKTAYSAQWKKKYDTKPGFEAKVIAGKYGYILVSNMLFFDTSPAYIHRLAQPLYEQIAALKAKNRLDGWIIDLRFNSGGNSAPMLLALYDFLGDQEIWGSLDINKKVKSKVRFKKGKYIDQGKTTGYIDPSGALLDQTKVAVITGIFTASAGEVVGLAFKGRPNTLFIGESTYGATTGNVSWPLPFGITMALTTTYDSDRNGNYYEQLVPDIAISKQDHFDDLLLDKNIVAAIKFLSANK